MFSENSPRNEGLAPISHINLEMQVLSSISRKNVKKLSTSPSDSSICGLLPVADEGLTAFIAAPPNPVPDTEPNISK